MEYRIHPRTKDRISVIGIGSSYLSGAGEKEGVSALEKAASYGFNYFDLAAGDAACFPYFGKALSPVRSRIFYQVHFGADYTRGAYGWTLKLDRVRRSVEWQLQQLKTDYIDYGFIHCLDEAADWEAYQRNGVLDYLLRLRDQGIVRHLGASSHTPAIHQQILDTGLVDTIMFSINPAYDCGQGTYANGSAGERNALYLRCASEGVGITVMKPFSGGQLLRSDLSPFGQALSVGQCIRYALGKPGVLTVLPGIRSVSDVEVLQGCLSASGGETDDAVLPSFLRDVKAACVYCNHCAPCPAGIDIAAVNKYYDLARTGDGMADTHYRNLSRNATDCIQCGHCTKRCPFHIDPMARMQEIRTWFHPAP